MRKIQEKFFCRAAIILLSAEMVREVEASSIHSPKSEINKNQTTTTTKRDKAKHAGSFSRCHIAACIGC